MKTMSMIKVIVDTRDNELGYTQIAVEFEEWLNDQGIEFQPKGCSQSSSYYRIDAGLMVYPDGDENKIERIVRLSNHKSNPIYGSVDWQVKYTETCLNELTCNHDGFEIVELSISDVEIASFLNWLEKAKTEIEEIG